MNVWYESARGPFRSRSLPGRRLYRRAAQVAGRGILDLLAASGGFAVACAVAGAGGGSGVRALDAGCATLGAGFGAVLILLFADQGLYRPQGSVLNIGEPYKAIKGIGLGAAVFLSLLFLAGMGEPARGPVLTGIFAGSAIVLAERRLMAAVMNRLQVASGFGRRVLLYGCGDTGERLMKKILQAPQLGSTVVGFLDDFAPVGGIVRCHVSQVTREEAEARILGRLYQLEEIVKDQQVDELLVALPHVPPERIESVIERCRRLGISVGVVPKLGGVRPDQLQVTDLGGFPVLRPYSPHGGLLYRLTKRGIDLAVSAALIALLAPAWAVAALLIRLDSPGPAIFSQQRVGLGGRLFRMYKLRTMRTETDPYAPSPSDDDDPRITRVGRWLRIAGFDETPQLLNVLKGEMTLVGPRPEMPFIVETYGELERQRLGVEPGITGLWQLSADRGSEIHANIEYDLHYVQHRSTLMDIAILLETAFFTAGLAAHRLLARGRRSARRDRRASTATRPAALPAALPALGEHETRRDDFALVALDQPVDPSLPELWRELVPIVCGASRDVSVKLLVAERNAALVEDFLVRLAPNGARGDGRPELVPYPDEARLRRMVRDAAVVLTDLPEVARFAEEGVSVLVVQDRRRIRWHNVNGSPVARTLLDALSDGSDGGPPARADGGTPRRTRGQPPPRGSGRRPTRR